MAQFSRGETIICSCEVKNSNGIYTDPQTSMKITITDFQNSDEVDDANMIWTSVGKYHYDWNTSVNNLKGIYTVLFKATDGTRITIKKETIDLR